MDLPKAARIHARHYESLARKYGATSQGVQYPDLAGHWARFRELVSIGVEAHSSVLDFGCGSGSLLDFLDQELSFRGKYLGIDLVDEQLMAARQKYPDAQFENRDLFSEGLPGHADYVLVNGVFNNRFDGIDAQGYMKEILRRLMPCARKGLAFNALSTYVDYMDASLNYFNPEDVFRFCKEELSSLVNLRHDYFLKQNSPAFEFTIYVFPSDIPARPRYEA